VFLGSICDNMYWPLQSISIAAYCATIPMHMVKTWRLTLARATSFLSAIHFLPIVETYRVFRDSWRIPGIRVPITNSMRLFALTAKMHYLPDSPRLNTLHRSLSSGTKLFCQRVFSGSAANNDFRPFRFLYTEFALRRRRSTVVACTTSQKDNSRHTYLTFRFSSELFPKELFLAPLGGIFFPFGISAGIWGFLVRSKVYRGHFPGIAKLFT